jgi:hypothetical protein
MLMPFHTNWADDWLGSYIPNAEVVGEGRMSFMFWDVYDAALIAPNGIWDKTQPYALKLKYLRALDGHKIADRSIEEIRKLGCKDELKLAAWHGQLNTLFPNVDAQTVLIGIFTPSGSTKFYHDDEFIGEISDAEFGPWFFNIWLSESTSAPKLRAALLGQ